MNQTSFKEIDWLDNWLWRHLDIPIVRILKWVSYMILLVGILKGNPTLILAGAVLWLAHTTALNTFIVQRMHDLSSKQNEHYEKYVCPIHKTTTVEVEKQK